MAEKFIEVQIPEGYEIDRDKSVFTKIVFKKKKETKVWDDLLTTVMPVDSRYIHSNSTIEMNVHNLFDKEDKNMFIDEKHAKASLAMAQISQLLPYYGGAITDEEWANDTINKYTIERIKNYAVCDVHTTRYFFLAFHTIAQRKSFLENNSQLIDDYLMITKNE